MVNVASFKRFFSDPSSIEIKFIHFILKSRNFYVYLRPLLIVLLFVAFTCSSIGKWKIYNYLSKSFHGVVKLVTILSDSSIVLFTVIALQKILSLDTFGKLTKYAYQNGLLNNETYPTWISPLIWPLRLAVFTPIAVNSYFMCYLIGQNMYLYYITKDLLYWLHNCMVIGTIIITVRITDSFASINRRLNCLNYSSGFVFNGIPFIRICELKTSQYRLADLKKLIMMHNNLCDYLDKINEAGKTLFVMLLTCIVTNLIHNFTILMEFGIKSKTISGVETTPYILTTHLLLAVITISQVILLGMVGENLEQEGKTTSKICFSLLNKLPALSKCETDLMAYQQLNVLLDQSKTRSVYLHAGGFFRFNYGIVGSIAGTVATYSIVIIQMLLM